MNSQQFQPFLYQLDNLSFTQPMRLRHAVKDEMSSNQVARLEGDTATSLAGTEMYANAR